MAEKLCNLRKYGGGNSLKETTLWTNPSPTSKFNATTITLNDSIGNYKYIIIAFNGTNLSGSSSFRTPMYPIETVRQATYATNKLCIELARRAAADADQIFYRPITYTNDTSLYIRGCVMVNKTESVNQGNNVPTAVIGIK